MLSLQAVKKIGVSQMRNLSSLISLSQAFFSLQTPASPTLTSQSYIKICDLYARPIRKKPLPNKSQIIGKELAVFSRIDVIWKKACAGGHMTDEKRHLDRKDSLR